MSVTLLHHLYATCSYIQAHSQTTSTLLINSPMFPLLQWQWQLVIPNFYVLKYSWIFLRSYTIIQAVNICTICHDKKGFRRLSDDSTDIYGQQQTLPVSTWVYLSVFSQITLHITCFLVFLYIDWHITGRQNGGMAVLLTQCLHNEFWFIFEAAEHRCKSPSHLSLLQ